jgi:hypothetical protein
VAGGAAFLNTGPSIASVCLLSSTEAVLAVEAFFSSGVLPSAALSLAKTQLLRRDPRSNGNNRGEGLTERAIIKVNPEIDRECFSPLYG